MLAGSVAYAPVEPFHHRAGARAALRVVRRRSGTWFDPRLARLSLIDDQWALARARKATVGQVLGLVAGLKGEDDLYVLRGLAEILSWLHHNVVRPSTERAFRELVDFTRPGVSTWTAWDGRKIRYSYAEHAVTLSGVSPTQVRVNDPLHGTQYWVSKATFETSWADFNNMAVVF